MLKMKECNLMKNNKVTIKEALIFWAIGIFIGVLSAVSWFTTGEIELIVLTLGVICFILGVVFLILSLISSRKSKEENSEETIENKDDKN